MTDVPQQDNKDPASSPAYEHDQNCPNDGTCNCTKPDIKVKKEVRPGKESKEKTFELFFYRTGWQNRSVFGTDDKTSKPLYHAEIPWCGWNTSFTVQRNDSEGEIVAKAYRARPFKPVEISFSDAQQTAFIKDGTKLILKYRTLYSAHKFTYRGRELAWKSGYGIRRLVDLNTGDVIAEFHPKCLSIGKDGRLEIKGEYANDPLWVDVIVTTSLSCQQREREQIRAIQSKGVTVLTGHHREKAT